MRRLSYGNGLPPPPQQLPPSSFALAFGTHVTSIALLYEVTIQGSPFGWNSMLEASGNLVATGLSAYLAACVTFNKHAVVDALMARPFDCVAIMRSAGGRAGIRTAIYCGTVKMASFLAIVATLPGAFSVSAALASPLLVALPMVMAIGSFPVLFPVYLVGALSGHLLGRGALKFVGNASPLAAASLVHRFFHSHALDVAFSVSPRRMQAAAVLAAVISSLPWANRFIGNLEIDSDKTENGESFSWHFRSSNSGVFGVPPTKPKRDVRDKRDDDGDEKKGSGSDTNGGSFDV